MIRGAALLAILTIAPAVTGCHPTAETRPVGQGRLATDGVRIEAEDRSFTIEPRARFHPPFQVDTRALRAGAWDRENIGGQAVDAQRIGAERVRVHVDGLAEPLYGVLMLSRAPAESSGPTWRVYQIQVPPSHVQAARGGTSVVYEFGEAWFSWILWLSDAPFERPAR